MREDGSAISGLLQEQNRLKEKILRDSDSGIPYSLAEDVTKAVLFCLHSNWISWQPESAAMAAPVNGGSAVLLRADLIDRAASEVRFASIA